MTKDRPERGLVAWDSPTLEVDLGDSFSEVATEVLRCGEAALIQVRKSLDHWIASGAAWKTLQLGAMHRSNSNEPSGRRYAAAYSLLIHPYPELARIDRKTRNDAIWLFENQEPVKDWLQTLPQKRQDRVNHPTRVREHFEKRHPARASKRSTVKRPRPAPRVILLRPLGEATREDLELIVGELQSRLDARDQELLTLSAELAERDREIARLKNDLAWERAERRQLEGLVAPAAATVVRPDGETVEIIHAVSRDSYEVPVPSAYGQPDFAAWARLVKVRIAELSLRELDWLLQDNRESLDAVEGFQQGAGSGLTQRIRQRIEELADKEAEAEPTA